MEPEKNIDNQTDRKLSKIFPVIFPLLFLAVLAALFAVMIFKKNGNPFSFPKNLLQTKQNSFEESFQKNETIEETAKMPESSNSNWWVNSGGQMIFEKGVGKTIQGDLPDGSKWKKKYEKGNPKDTDGGKHPQNIFRLVTKTKWQNFDQEAYFRINRLNLSSSENQNESNGILLFNRYEDGDNLYYTGLRVDGTAVIKKKYAGKYYTLNEKVFFPGSEYDRDNNPNLLPLDEWIGLKAEFRNTTDGNADIKLYVKVGRGGEWKLAASVTDDGRKEFGTHIIDGEGYAGIRTDFMDVEFSDYKISETR